MGNMLYGASRPIFKRAEELRGNQTAEEKLWIHLKSNHLGVRFKRQHPIWIYIADFYCHELRLVIEINGSIHDLKEVIENDKLRQEDIISFGIRVIRLTNQEVRTDLNSVIERIQSLVNEIKNNQVSNEKSD